MPAKTCSLKKMARSSTSSMLFLAFVFALSARSYAGDGCPARLVRISSFKQIASKLNDTVPDIKKVPEARTDSASKASAIKEVPKSKKQLAPALVPVTVKALPIKIIKPKIIRPVIKVN